MGGRQDIGGSRASGLVVYAEQFAGNASEEYRGTLGRKRRTACRGDK